MKTVRQDAWTPEDDGVLVEVILRHIRTSSTQLAAFEEAGQTLGRTRAACGFRWNAVLRKEYAAQLEIAKAERRANRETVVQSEGVQERQVAPVELGTIGEREVESDSVDLTWCRVIKFLKARRDDDEKLRKRVKQVDTLQRENRALQEENLRLHSELSVIRGDYLALVKIMERARKEVMPSSEPIPERPTQLFKMDENGNLERME
ncbi:RsfA family transcriptional regulator [Tumebacillus sp. ITR2]|uniref:RsfA family transcriptional regulator n=1 Tax=Tumebacillus amylolyticus TaxID=2801339 RepID=A0ABS1JD20_9BACL|nr:RsfA family transcriptional regulator [Tumebacillus amylolyticus]MBL0388171.1 RsfA family transcriptional regulator [Tumebacillus amylolyticus]